ncbi:MAG: polyprenyl synthetase family protein [Candidatus Marinimicrobia bacterium]|jgi:octaprenyl-diphosphate synthase|nr:polyprenyl synthetase family protein [Candidatus Neomarinimicrobiota bacterium]MDP6593203.1 polyprenyl synthetase family protein [Candidatus Neomarinimicrobiota bacterium]MDP6835992.1 polyprenyl synthetase family protein [Candidatus Neomarinimicrobiota bacterium]MDP6966287.1 polyprenyl synthetase family protein [Candidatus Neomarinimicrobiota bacterium]|tara:strand:+ start:6217 stop:7203 length:987 start_codon:yes stop_codon:yes gene_type:complete
MKQTKELRQIVEPIFEDMKLFQQEFEAALRSEVRLINIIGRYLMRHKGKGVRPILTILSARMSGGPSLHSYKAAAMVELLHMATLMHDDVVDEADKRRGFPTVNKIWKNKTSIVMGDFILSKVLTNLTGLKDFDALELISHTAERLSSGEMLQIERSFKNNMTEDVYYRMIRDKTASLISTCCELGVMTASKKQGHKVALGTYGENFGMAFQIKDDLFDILGSEHSTGKDANSDVTRNMVTLPIIHTLGSQLTTAERNHIRRTMSKGASRKNIKHLKEIVKEYGGFEYAMNKIEEFSDRAVAALAQFPDSPYKRSLIDLSLYNAQRTR